MRTLIAGLGNVFESDDGFGSAVAAVVAGMTLPPGTEVHDFGIRGVHLAYQLLEPYDLVVIIDAVARGGEPGTLYVIQHAPDDNRPHSATLDAHDMAPDEVLALVPVLGGVLGRVMIVGCEPAVMAPGMELSVPVARSVEAAAQLTVEIVQENIEAAAADRVRIGG